MPRVYLELIRRLNGLFPGFQLLNSQFPLRVALIVPQVLLGVLQCFLGVLDLLCVRHPFPLSRGGVILTHRPFVPGVQKLILLFQDVQLQLFQLFASLRLLVLLLQSVYLLINGIRLRVPLLLDGVDRGLCRFFSRVVQFGFSGTAGAAGTAAVSTAGRRVGASAPPTVLGDSSPQRVLHTGIYPCLGLCAGQLLRLHQALYGSLDIPLVLVCAQHSGSHGHLLRRQSCLIPQLLQGGDLLAEIQFCVAGGDLRRHKVVQRLAGRPGLPRLLHQFGDIVLRGVLRHAKRLLHPVVGSHQFPLLIGNFFARQHCRANGFHAVLAGGVQVLQCIIVRTGGHLPGAILRLDSFHLLAVVSQRHDVHALRFYRTNAQTTANTLGTADHCACAAAVSSVPRLPCIVLCRRQLFFLLLAQFLQDFQPLFLRVCQFSGLVDQLVIFTFRLIQRTLRRLHILQRLFISPRLFRTQADCRRQRRKDRCSDTDLRQNIHQRFQLSDELGGGHRVSADGGGQRSKERPHSRFGHKGGKALVQKRQCTYQQAHLHNEPPGIAVQELHQPDHAVQRALDGVRLHQIADELRPLVVQYLGLAGPTVQRIFHFLVRAARRVSKISQHGLVHIPVLDQCQKLGGTQLAADVADHLHQLLFGQQAVLHALGQTGNGLHGVYYAACGLRRIISVLGIDLDDIPQSGDLPGGPRHALVDLRLGIADDIQEKRPQRGGGLCAASLRHSGDRTDSRRQLIHAHMGLRRNRCHLAQALGDLLDRSCVFVVDLVGAVQHGGELFNVALILVRRVHGQQELLRRFGVGVTHDLRLGSQLRQCGRLFAVASAAEARHELQVLVRRHAIGAGGVVCLFLDLIQLRRGRPGDFADRHHLVVHGFHGVQCLNKTALYTGDSVAHHLPQCHFCRHATETVTHQTGKAGGLLGGFPDVFDLSCRLLRSVLHFVAGVQPRSFKNLCAIRSALGAAAADAGNALNAPLHGGGRIPLILLCRVCAVGVCCDLYFPCRLLRRPRLCLEVLRDLFAGHGHLAAFAVKGLCYRYNLADFFAVIGDGMHQFPIRGKGFRQFFQVLRGRLNIYVGLLRINAQSHRAALQLRYLSL